MIFGVSHLVAATVMPISDSAWPAGWHAAAPAEHLLVDTKKSGYLSTSYREHGFVLLRHDESSPGVELISYGDTSGHQCHYLPAFGPTDWHQLLGQVRRNANIAAWPTLDVGYIGNANLPLSTVAIYVANLADSRRFWCEGVGFRVEAQFDDAVLLSFPALVSGWKLNIVLVADKAVGNNPGMLDDSGWNCLSLLVDDLESTAVRLCRNGGRDPSDVIHVPVGGKQLDILFLRGPGGEIVELLDVNTVRRRP